MNGWCPFSDGLGFYQQSCRRLALPFLCHCGILWLGRAEAKLVTEKEAFHAWQRLQSY
jgi:hypothetical protein